MSGRGRSRSGVVIIGGGVIGASIAYHLKAAGVSERIVVLERDPTYRFASSRLAFGGIRQQFTSAVSVRMAQRSVEFYRRFDDTMSVGGRPAAAKFRQRGYLFLADAGNAETLDRRFSAMTLLGVAVEKLEVAQMRRRVPELEVADLLFGLFGPEDGYADAPAVLAGFRAKAASLGVEFLADEVASIDTAGGTVRHVTCRRHGEIETERLVCAAGAYAAKIGHLAGLDIPVRPVRQQLVRAVLPRPWEYEFPVVMDPTGVHWRSAEGNTIVIAKTETEEAEGFNFAPDPDRFEKTLHPVLARRVPEFAGLEPVSAWAGLYEMTPDQNAILGPHPDLPGFFLACGFSGHGLMMAPATGEVVAAMITGTPAPLDVSELSVERLRSGALLRDGAMI